MFWPVLRPNISIFCDAEEPESSSRRRFPTPSSRRLRRSAVGREPTAQERLQLRTRYSPESGIAAIFDPNLNLLVFPTHYVARDLEHVVLHELGHALTMSLANPRAALLKDLPPGIA